MRFFWLILSCSPIKNVKRETAAYAVLNKNYTTNIRKNFLKKVLECIDNRGGIYVIVVSTTNLGYNI